MQAVGTFPPPFEGLQRIKLSDKQWQEIQKASGLPDSARKRVEHTLSLHRYFQRGDAQRPTASDTRKELRGVAELADKLITTIIGDNASARKALNGLLKGGDFPIESILSGSKPDVLEALMSARRGTLQQLCRSLEAVEQLRNRFEYAARALPAESRGASRKAANNRSLVGGLDAILYMTTGKRLSGSKDHVWFVTLCFEAADPDIGRGSIQEAMKSYRHPTVPGEITEKRRG